MDNFYESPAAIAAFHQSLAAYPAHTPVRMVISIREDSLRETREDIFHQRKHPILAFLQAAGGKLEQEYPTISALAVTALPAIFSELVKQPALLADINFLEEEGVFPNPRDEARNFTMRRFLNSNA